MLEAENTPLYKIRHSLAHVLAQAVLERFPNAKLGFGPPTDQGFFYDFDFGSQPLQEDNLKELEKIMKKIIRQKQVFETYVFAKDEALAHVQNTTANPYKMENITNLAERGVTDFRFYKNAQFIDLCEGPHVTTTGDLPEDCFKLDRIAGAYWLGNEKNKMLTRIYALAFETKADLDDFIKRREMAEKFDHKKLGKELDIYHQNDTVGQGLILWLPNGTVIRDEIERYAKEMEFRFGYKRVATPHISKADLYHKSQHLPAYAESMYPPMVITDGDVKTEYYLKPMNCPHHHLIFDARMRSYKELPLRLAEYGTTYRFEQSGELAGLLRVRCMTLNDAHIYLAESQVEEECRNVLKLYSEFYKTFKLSGYSYRLSIRGEENAAKFKGDSAMWDRGEEILTRVLDELGLPYYVGKGEGAFYGPKIDIQFKNLMGREETVSTVQVDFLAPVNFGLKYIDENGQEKAPVIIHRSPLSTHERFVSFLLEYYGGAFPTWCAPVQVSILPVKDGCNDYAREVEEMLRAEMVRVEVDDSANSFGKKIRTNTMKKIPILLIIGEQEVAARTVTVRRYGMDEQKTVELGTFVPEVLSEIKNRVMLREPTCQML